MQRMFYPFLAFFLAVKVSADHPAPVYDVNLDLPPEERWVHVVHDFKHLIGDIDEMYRTVLDNSPELVEIMDYLGDNLEQYVPEPYGGEIRGVATAFNYSLGGMLWWNFLYELTSYCTSIVGCDTNGTIWHGRNVDYAFTGILKNISIDVNFKSGGQTIYKATTSVGYVGIVTGYKPGVFSISMDERDQGGWWRNAAMALFDRDALPLAFLIRNTIETATSFTEAVDMLIEGDTYATAYMIVGGLRHNEGVVITKSRFGPSDKWNLGVDAGTWYLLETNYDHWNLPPVDDNRRDAGNNHMEMLGWRNFNGSTLYNVLSLPPTLNNETIYTTIMSAAIADEYRTVIRDQD